MVVAAPSKLSCIRPCGTFGFVQKRLPRQSLNLLSFPFSVQATALGHPHRLTTFRISTLRIIGLHCSRGFVVSFRAFAFIIVQASWEARMSASSVSLVLKSSILQNKKLVGSSCTDDSVRVGKPLSASWAAALLKCLYYLGSVRRIP